MDPPDVLQSTHLLAVIANFASKNRPLPGVRVPRKGSGSAPTTSASHYNADRQKLLDIYARRWLQALHDLQPDGCVMIVTPLTEQLCCNDL